MITDAQLLFSDAQAVTASAASTNYVDLGPFGDPLGAATNSGIDIGHGTPVFAWVTCDVVMTDAGDDSTVVVTIQQDDNTAFSSATTVATFTTFAAESAAGTQYFVQLPPELTYEKYLRAYFTVADGNLTTGSFSCGLSLDMPKWAGRAQGPQFSKGTAGS